MTINIEKIEYLGHTAYRMEAMQYSAIVVPECGGNIISFECPQKNMKFLRTPKTVEELLDKSSFYGNPVLLPPNRIYAGKFKANGKEYIMPLNSRDGLHYIHGILRHLPWKVSLVEKNESQCKLTLSMFVDEHHEMFSYFPHKFEFKLSYVLSQDGLTQGLSIHNMGEESMPLGLGFHTAINVPFIESTQAVDYRLRLSVGDQWELDEKMLPTGRIVENENVNKELSNEGINPLEKPIATKHFAAHPIDFNGNCFHGAVISYEKSEDKLVYEVDSKFKHWVLWNDNADKGYFCPEPMTWMINAPNLEIPTDISGFDMIAAGEVWTARNRLYLI